MKSTLEFQLPEEKNDLEVALKAGEYYSIVWEFNNYLYRVNKHDTVIPEKQLRVIQQKWKELLDDTPLHY